MKKQWIGVLLAAVLCMAPLAAAFAQEAQLDPAPDRTSDLTALQNGARTFANYCMNCHSASLLRFNRLQDIGIAPAEVEKNLIFTGAKVGDTMTAAMRPADAKAWFGVAPPDLSLEERARGADWIYTYLRSFYKDPSRPTGWNNVAFPNVAMPNVFWQLQGTRTVKYEKKTAESGEVTEHLVGYTQVTPGTMSQMDFDNSVADLVSFMTWMAEPARKTRQQVGVWVLLFLGVLSLFAWRLNAAYWKDV